MPPIDEKVEALENNIRALKTGLGKLEDTVGPAKLDAERANLRIDAADIPGLRDRQKEDSGRVRAIEKQTQKYAAWLIAGGVIAAAFGFTVKRVFDQVQKLQKDLDTKSAVFEAFSKSNIAVVDAARDAAKSDIEGVGRAQRQKLVNDPILRKIEDEQIHVSEILVEVEPGGVLLEHRFYPVLEKSLGVSVTSNPKDAGFKAEIEQVRAKCNQFGGEVIASVVVPFAQLHEMTRLNDPSRQQLARLEARIVPPNQVVVIVSEHGTGDAAKKPTGKIPCKLIVLYRNGVKKPGS